MQRFFEKVSYTQFFKDSGYSEEAYESIILPSRATRKSSGYDFFSYNTFMLDVGEEIKIPTGIKVCTPDNEWLSIIVRSGAGFNYNIRLKNQVGNIDADYYNNPANEGHIWVALKNEGRVVWVVQEGEAYVQGVFLPYYVTDDDCPRKEIREGGLGHSSKK